MMDNQGGDSVITMASDSGVAPITTNLPRGGSIREFQGSPDPGRFGAYQWPRPQFSGDLTGVDTRCQYTGTDTPTDPLAGDEWLNPSTGARRRFDGAAWVTA